MTDTLLRAAAEKAKPILDRFGIVASPLRDVFSARRALTVERPMGQVSAFLGDDARAAELFLTGEAATVAAVADARVEWRMGTRARASADLREGPNESTEVVMEVHLERPADGGRPRYADNAGVIAIRALHRAKSLIETGEPPSLAVNPAARPVPDPYGD